ncbi:hypothetical protein BB560_001637 [Smittium megazygosporum]|uniref:Bud22 domain-containing protein n=1 Tax=Smittium megazygosporum TaxID=133381 RepID=A0A2T9ZH06_9FUNG|nr:hypothetical protein BB560_001637 [Smittium megazygosporum]
MPQKENLYWKIGLLEAQVESTSSIPRTQIIAESLKRKELKKTKHIQKAHDSTTSESKSNEIDSSFLENDSIKEKDLDESSKKLYELRVLKAKQKLHHTKSKLRSLIKKYKGVQIQKTVKLLRKLKDKLNSESVGDKAVHIERQISAENEFILKLKELDLEEESHNLFIRYISENPEFSKYKEELDLPDAIYNSADMPTESKVLDPALKKLKDLQQRIIRSMKTFKPLIECLKELDAAIEIINGKNSLKMQQKRTKSQSLDEHQLKQKTERPEEKTNEDDSEKNPDEEIEAELKKMNQEFGVSESEPEYESQAEYNSYSSFDENASDYSDDPTDKSEERPAKRRKNRMGQRQRREMYEKVYGKKANHLQSLPKALRTDKKGQSRFKKSFGNIKSNIPQVYQFENSEENSLRSNKPSAHDNEFPEKNHTKSDSSNKENFNNKNPNLDPSLHPSWAAKQLERKKMALINSGQVKGNKIVFD